MLLGLVLLAMHLSLGLVLVGVGAAQFVIGASRHWSDRGVSIPPEREDRAAVRPDGLQQVGSVHSRRGSTGRPG